MEHLALCILERDDTNIVLLEQNGAIPGLPRMLGLFGGPIENEDSESAVESAIDKGTSLNAPGINFEFLGIVKDIQNKIMGHVYKARIEVAQFDTLNGHGKQEMNIVALPAYWDQIVPVAQLAIEMYLGKSITVPETVDRKNGRYIG